MFKKIIKTITILLIFMSVNHVYAYNQNLIIKDKTKSNIIFLHLDELKSAKIKVNVINSSTKENIRKSNIKFTIKNTDTNEYICENDKCIFNTDENGTFITTNELIKGNYILEQIDDQDIYGYLLNETPLEFTISEDSDYDTIDDVNIITINFENREAKGGFKLTVNGEIFRIGANEFAYQDYPLVRSNFELYAKEDIYNQEGILVYQKDKLIKNINYYYKNDNIITDLYFGSYYLKQITSYYDNVVLEEPYSFTLEYLDKYPESNIIPIEIKNHLPKGTLIINFKDSITEEPIKNNEIKLYTDTFDLLYTGFSDEEGKITIPNLVTIVKYHFNETVASVGYVLDDKTISFEFTNDNEIISYDLTNDIITGTFILTKVDYSTNEPISDALIGIYNLNDELLYSEYTDEDGQIIIENLKYGKYYYQEIEAPDGYILNEEKIYFEIKENNEIVYGNMTSEEITVPDTNKNENYLWLVVSIISFISGGSLIVYGKKK